MRYNYITIGASMVAVNFINTIYMYIDTMLAIIIQQ